jgi:hypothetical protein
MTWKDRAQVALGVPMETQNAIVVVEVPFREARTDRKTRAASGITVHWEWWQVIAPAIITVCVIAQLVSSVR